MISLVKFNLYFRRESLIDNKDALMFAKYIANEAINVGIASGLEMEPMQGFDLGKLLKFNTIEERDANDHAYEAFFGPHRKLKASMLQDLEKGRKCEIDAINGVVCDFGRKYEYEFSNLEMMKIPE